MMRFVWLAMALPFACLSLLTIFEAPGITGWELAILATQFGHWLAVLALACAAAVALVGRMRRNRGSPGFARTAAIVIFVGSAALLVTPALRAWQIGRRAPGEMDAIFGTRKDDDIARASASFVNVGQLFSFPSHARVATEVFTYARVDGRELALEVFRAQRTSRAAAACVVVVHGGGWNRGARDELPEFDHWLARAGYTVVAIDYRLAPEWKWPAPRDDARAALTWLREHAAIVGCDPDRIVLLGRSAGAQIALAVAYEAGAGAVRGVISLYGPSDLEFAYTTGRDDDALHSLTLLREYLGGTPAEIPATYADASPLFRASREVPPTLLVHGQLDTLVWRRQSERLAHRLAEAHAPAYYLAVPAATHALEYNLDGPGGQLACGAVLRFLEATVGN